MGIYGKAAMATLIATSSAATAFAMANVVTSTIDGGGQRANSANYVMDGSAGGIGGFSSASADTARNGYIGQLYEVVSIVVTAAPNPVSEDSNAVLTATATLDDATVLALAGSDVSWSSAGIPYPLNSISAGGVATATNVYQNTAATVNGYYLGATSNATLLVLDTFPDNYGSYAGDGIPDSWQAQYFGLNNPNAAPGIDADGTGQNNLFKYVAGLDPTNPASIFVLQIQNVTGQPVQKKLLFNPLAAARTYTVEFSTNLVSGSYAALAGFSGPLTNGNQMTVTDTNAVEAVKFYHIKITFP
jgi:hypothetical protein